MKYVALALTVEHTFTQTCEIEETASELPVERLRLTGRCTLTSTKLRELQYDMVNLTSYNTTNKVILNGLTMDSYGCRIYLKR